MSEESGYVSADRLHELSLSISTKLDWAVGYILCSLERLNDPNLPADEMLTAVEEGMDSVIIELENAFAVVLEFDRLIGHDDSSHELSKCLDENTIELVIEVYREAALRAHRLYCADQSAGHPRTPTRGLEFFWRHKTIPLVRLIRSSLIKGCLPEVIESEISDLRRYKDELEIENKRFALIARSIFDGDSQMAPSEERAHSNQIDSMNEPVRPASWFDDATNGLLNADRLRMATKGNPPRLVAGKSGHFNTYSVHQVTRVWPQYEPKILDALNRDRS